VQWAAIKTASVLVGLVGGHLAESRDVGTAFVVAGLLPLLSLVMVGLCVREKGRPADRAAVYQTLDGIRHALRSRDLWAVAGFIFFWTFSPSFDTALLFHQTDVLHFGAQFIGVLGAVGSIGGIAGALAYPVLSRRMRLRRLVNLVIGLGVAGTLAYLAYRDPITGLAIEALYGCAGTIATLAFLELAAKAAPRHVLRAADGDLQRGRAPLGDRRRAALRPARLPDAGRDLRRAHRAGLAPRAVARHRRVRGPGPGRGPIYRDRGMSAAQSA